MRPGPQAARQDYVDAFTAAPAKPEDAWSRWPDGDLGDGPARPRVRSRRRKDSGRNKGRYATGIAAAVVATALAAAITAQAKGGDADKRLASAADPGHPEPGNASRSEKRSEPTAEPKVEPLSYAEQMDRAYPLDPKLKGSGKLVTVAGGDKAPGKGSVVRYQVDVEEGLPLEAKLFAEAVHKTLNDKRSWGADGERSFERVSSGRADFVITLASPGTTAKWCAKSGLDTTQDNVSCDSASTDRVMINAYRWAQGAKTYGDELFAYRQMLINHEVGHRLGFGHVGCPKDGALAPVMMQQTKFLSTDGASCKPNAWPHP